MVCCQGMQHGLHTLLQLLQSSHLLQLQRGSSTLLLLLLLRCKSLLQAHGSARLQQSLCPWLQPLPLECVLRRHLVQLLHGVVRLMH